MPPRTRACWIPAHPRPHARRLAGRNIPFSGLTELEAFPAAEGEGFEPSRGLWAPYLISSEALSTSSATPPCECYCTTPCVPTLPIGTSSCYATVRSSLAASSLATALLVTLPHLMKQKRQMTLLIALIGVGVVALFLLPRLFTTREGSPPQSTGGAPAANTQQSTAPLPSEEMTQARGLASEAPETVTIRVEAGNFFFRPNRIEVTKGDRVRIVLINREGVHNLVLEAFGVRTPTISTGEQAEITFVANKIGSFEYYCSVSNHRQLGMVGTLVVKPREE